jgi:hypothetical protein
MAKKDTKAAATKTVKSAGARSPGGKPETAASKPFTANRRPAKTAPDAPGETVETRAPMTGNTRADLSPEEVYRLIQETAYYKAKARGFAPGNEVQDWIEAEAEVRLRLESRA